VQSTLKETLTDCLNQPEQIKEFVYMINETETKMEKTFVESFAMLFYRFIECLIVRKLIDCSKQVGFSHFKIFKILFLIKIKKNKRICFWMD